MNLNDPRNIVPRAFPPGSYDVRPLEFAVRTVVDYDPNYLRDRVHASIFINGQPSGIYAARAIEDSNWVDPREVLVSHAPRLEQEVIREFMGIDYRDRIKALEAEVALLREHINRPRWWRRAGHAIARRWRSLAGRG